MAAGTRADSDDLRSRAARGTLWIAAGALVSKAGLSVVLLVLAAVLSPAELGVLAIGTLVVMIASQVQDLGLADELTYRKGDVDRAARTTLTLTLAVGAVTSACVVLAAPAVAAFFHEPRARWVVAGLGCGLVLQAAALVPLALMTRTLDFRRRAIPTAVPGLVGGAVTVVLALTGVGIASLVVGELVAGVVLVALAWLVGPRVRPGWSAADARAGLVYGLPLVGAALLGLAQLNVDYVLVGRLLSAAELGLYSLAFRLAFLPFLAVTQVVNGAAFPLYCRLEDRVELARTVVRVTGAVLLGLVPLVVGLAVFAPSVVVLGSEWAPAVDVLRWLAAFCLAYSLGQCGQVALKAVGRTRAVLVLRVVHLTALTVALLVALSLGDLVTVAVVQAAVAAAVAVLTWATLGRSLPLPVPVALDALRAPVVGGAVMAAAGVLLSTGTVLGSDSSLLSAAGRGLLAVAVYAGAVLLVDRQAVSRIRAALRGQA